MVYTGDLWKDATTAQIRAAKKTVQVITEVDGHKYIEEFDGTNGYAVLVNAGETTEGRTVGSGETVMNFAQTILRKIPERLVMMIFAHRIGLVEENPFSVIQGGKQDAK